MQTMSNPSSAEHGSDALERDKVQALAAATTSGRDSSPPIPLSRMSRDSTSRHSSIRESTASFMRTMFAKRQADYHDDSPADGGPVQRSRTELGPPQQRRSAGTTTTSGVNRTSRTRFHLANNNQNNNNNNETLPGPARPPSLWRRLWHAPERRHFERELLLHTTAYKFLLVCFSLILLFGAELQELFLPRQADGTMDVIYAVVFVCLLADIAMRIDAEDNYFSFQACCWIRGCRCCCKNGNNNNNRRRSSGDSNNSNNGCCRFGSFLFWCDLCSTLTLLADMTWINKDRFGEKHFSIQLDAFGFAVDGLANVNDGHPVRFDLPLLMTIFQTARVARFIRSSSAVKLSSRINWYFWCNLLNPSWWCKRCLLLTKGRKASTNSSNNNANTAGSDGLDTANNSRHDSGSPRNVSWNSIGVGVLAAVKANATTTQRSYWHGLAAWFTVRWLGRTYLSKEDFRRHYAAVRIQRAWRAVLEQRAQPLVDETLSSEFLGDVAWKGRMSALGSMTTTTSSSLVRVPRKKTTAGRTPDSTTRNIQQSSDQQMQQVNQVTLTGVASHKRRNESQVGTAMRELTGQRVAIGIIVALFLTVFFTYVEQDTTRPATMVVLMNQTGNPAFADRSIEAARSSSVEDLYSYTMATGETMLFDVVEAGVGPDELRPIERVRITVYNFYNQSTVGLFNYRDERREEALVKLLSTVFILLVWFFGVTAFAGPVMVLVVVPIERMVRLLAMLMIDPLGYQGTGRYKRFVDEENEITKNTRWTPEILKGMETSFLMSTILRIGSLMKVGFGSAGVEIIRNNLEKGQSKNTLILSSQGSTVSCIFLFCDIRNFTDATECLQEEVFVFTNRIAAVVHSNCHSLGGSANKNIGDAFLLSWLLDEDNSVAGGSGNDSFSTHRGNTINFTAKNNQADKALLTVVRVCMALHYDDYYLETLTTGAREALVAKLKKRKGPIVQMGFGLHAGRAVQGAIGSQRKIDATYVSEAVERVEFLESSTKKYSVMMLMSDSFHRLLHPGNRRRCRKIDQILIREEEDEDEEEDILNGEVMELFTFDMDIVALWNDKSKKEAGRESDSDAGSRRSAMAKIPRTRRISARKKGDGVASDEMSETESGFFGAMGVTGVNHGTFGVESEGGKPSKLVLPTGPALYNANVWTSEDMKTIRQLYSDGLFFQKFNSGLQAFYSKDWEHAQQCFAVILERFEDGPSRYFMNQIEKHGGKPPIDFNGYGTA